MLNKTGQYVNDVGTVQAAKNVLNSIKDEENYILFERNFLGTDNVKEFYEIEGTINELLRKQMEISDQINRKTDTLYNEYKVLYYMKEKLIKPEFKLVLLLQISGAGDMQSVLNKIVDKPDNKLQAYEMLDLYYRLLNKLALFANKKSVLYSEFKLTKEEKFVSIEGKNIPVCISRPSDVFDICKYMSLLFAVFKGAKSSEMYNNTLRIMKSRNIVSQFLDTDILRKDYLKMAKKLNEQVG